MSTEGFRIRRAKVSDAPAIVRVLHAAYAQYRGRVQPPLQALSATAQEVARDLRTGKRGFFVAVVDDMIVGTLRYRRRRRLGKWVLGLSWLAVDPDYRNCGIGARLMKEAENLAMKAGIDELRGNVRAALPALARYYARMGYRVVGRRSKPGYPRYLLVIAKRLPSAPPSPSPSSLPSEPAEMP